MSATVEGILVLLQKAHVSLQAVYVFSMIVIEKTHLDVKEARQP
jgi:hypothetical protein